MSYKFIGLTNPPQNTMGHDGFLSWMIIWADKSNRFMCAPFGAHRPRIALEFHTSDKNESLASFMHMLHSDNKNEMSKEDELLICISWSQALRRLHDRDPNFDLYKMLAIWQVFFDEQQSTNVTQP